MASEMIERVARALDDELTRQCGAICTDDELNELARVAIEAMREPSASGIAAAQISSYVGPSGAIEVWHGMIDAALKEATNGK